MDRDLALQKLTQSKPELHRRFGVVDLALFGSTLRGEARADSDVDVLVRFDGPATSARYFGVQFYLEDLLVGLRAANLTELSTVLERIRLIKGIQSSETSIHLKTYRV